MLPSTGQSSTTLQGWLSSYILRRLLKLDKISKCYLNLCQKNISRLYHNFVALWECINFMRLKAGDFTIWFTPFKNHNMRLQLHYYVVYYLSNQPPPPATGQNPTAFQGWRLARHYTFLFLLEPTTFAQWKIFLIFISVLKIHLKQKKSHGILD